MNLVTFHNRYPLPFKGVEGGINFFVEPYLKSYRHFRAAINSEPLADGNPKTLLNRVTHIAMGIVLFVPGLNAIVNLAIRILFSPQLTKEDMDELNAWVKQGDASERRDIAKHRILHCLTHRTFSLDLCNLSLTSLPNMLKSLSLENLKHLDVDIPLDQQTEIGLACFYNINFGGLRFGAPPGIEIIQRQNSGH